MKRTGTIFKNIGRPMALFLCVALLLLSACWQSGSEENMQQAEHEEAPFISTEEMLADYDYMWYIIETQFPLLEEAERIGYLEKRGIDPEKIKETYRKRIIAETQQFDKDPYDISSSVPAYGQYKNSKEAIYTLFSQCLNSFKSLGHLRITASNIAWYGDEFSEKSDRFYESFGNSGSIEELHRYDPDELISLDYIEDIPVITVKRFDNGDDSAGKLIEKAERVSREIVEGEYKDAVIDIRGNPGGNDAVWRKGFSQLLYGYTCSYMTVGGFKAACLDYFGENYSRLLEKGTEFILCPAEAVNKESLFEDKSINDIMRKAQLDYIFQSKVTPNIPEPQGEVYEGRLWLLVDDRCASSAEELALFCQNTEAATVIGKKTFGIGATGAAPIYKRIELPNSGMCFEFEWIGYLNRNGTFNDLEGMIPDIETEDDALEVCLNIIENSDA